MILSCRSCQEKITILKEAQHTHMRKKSCRRIGKREQYGDLALIGHKNLRLPKTHHF